MMENKEQIIQDLINSCQYFERDKPQIEKAMEILSQFSGMSADEAGKICQILHTLIGTAAIVP